MNKRVSTDYKTYLSEDELPTHYYNLRVYTMRVAYFNYAASRYCALT